MSIAKRVFPFLCVVALSVFLVTGVSSGHASAAQAQDKPSGTQASAKVALTTVPSPAQKGSNTVRVKLTDGAGQPIPRAEVTITFFMAAMPSMNMPEMKTVIKGIDKGPGVYEGKCDLGSGGLWQVTITAQEDGKRIATKQLTVKATGGM